MDRGHLHRSRRRLNPSCHTFLPHQIRPSQKSQPLTASTSSIAPREWVGHTFPRWEMEVWRSRD